MLICNLFNSVINLLFKVPFVSSKNKVLLIVPHYKNKYAVDSIFQEFLCLLIRTQSSDIK